MRPCLAMVAALSLVTAAQAGVTINAINIGLVGSDGGYDLYAYTVIVMADTPAESVTAFGGTFSGSMYQLWEPGSISTPTLDRNSPGSINESYDTHLLLRNADLLIETAPSEDGPGVGSTLGGTFGIGPNAASQDLSLAQIVVPVVAGSGPPSQAAVTLTGAVTDINGTLTQISGYDAWLIPGDANTDGYVSLADYTVWAANYDPGGPGTAIWGTGDFTGDGLVTLADYTVWAANYTGAPASLVPEPATLGLLSVGGLALIRRRWGRG